MAESRAAKSSQKKSGEQDREHSREQVQQPTLSGPHADILELQQAVGNRAVSQLLGPGQESIPSHSSSTSTQTGVLQRKCSSCGAPMNTAGECAECQKKRLPLQRSANGHAQTESSEVV